MGYYGIPIRTEASPSHKPILMITSEQREQRKKYLGSSDLPAILGADPWRTASDVYLIKTSPLVPELEKEESGVIEIGNSFESGVLDLFEKKQRVELERNVFLEYRHYCSNLDALIKGGEPEVVEAKTTGKVEEWGPTDTDEVPSRVLIQTHQQMAIASKSLGTEVKVAWVPVLLPGFRNLEYRIYKINRDEELLNTIIEMGDRFWNEHIVPRIPPINFSPALDLLKRVRRVPAKTVELSDVTVRAWQTANAEKLRAEKLAKESLQELLVELGDAEAGTCEDGVFTYYEQSRRGFVVDPTKFRVPRLKKI